MPKPLDINKYEIAPANTPDAHDLRFLEQRGTVPALPASITSDHDPLGLIEHNNIHAVARERIFNGFSYVCKQVAAVNPVVREQLAAAVTSSQEMPQVVDLPEVRIGEFHDFGVRMTLASDHTGFEFHRADKGSKSGGFHIIRNSKGATILTRDPDAIYSGTEEEQGAFIGQAQKALEMYATKLSIPKRFLTEHNSQNSLDTPDLQQLVAQYKKEQQLTYRTRQALGKKAGQALNMAGRLITTPKGKNGELMAFGQRRLSPARIVMAALMLPVPVIGAPIAATPIPRPLGIELLSDGAGTVGDAFHHEPQPDPIKQYDDLHKDLPDNAHVPINPAESELPFIAGVTDMANMPTIDVTGSHPLEGTSPRHVTFDNLIPANKCIRLGVGSQVQNLEYYLGTTDPQIGQSVRIQVGKSAIYICNKRSDTAIDSATLNLLFDTRQA